jgi:hypothetical protein
MLGTFASSQAHFWFDTGDLDPKTDFAGRVLLVRGQVSARAHGNSTCTTEFSVPAGGDEGEGGLFTIGIALVLVVPMPSPDCFPASIRHAHDHTANPGLLFPPLPLQKGGSATITCSVTLPPPPLPPPPPSLGRPCVRARSALLSRTSVSVSPSPRCGDSIEKPLHSVQPSNQSQSQ